MKPAELSLVIPLFNEEENVVSLLNVLTSALKKEGISYEVLAVDNGSMDNTGDLIDKFSKKCRNVIKIKVKENKGYGFGVLSGLKKAK
ncbi:MAG: glycosyltransferase, partial [Candidatus Nanoarchaeia archaeon]|nr:glycosyltransferase [Candidatus Nanoarchaeia archaeon]